MGVEEPTDDEKAQMEQAQQNAQPDPAAVAAAQAKALKAKAGLDTAKTQESGAATVLKLTQAHALGGPEKLPSRAGRADRGQDGIRDRKERRAGRASTRHRRRAAA
jgi:hypothetical protein